MMQEDLREETTVPTEQVSEEAIAPEPVAEEVAAAPEVVAEETVAPEPVAEEIAATSEPVPEVDEFARAVQQMSTEELERATRTVRKGELLRGIVVHVDENGVLVDIGTKSEGIIPLNELTRLPHQSPEEVVQVGQEIDVMVLKPETEEGQVILSKKRADYEVTWSRLEEAMQANETVQGTVTERVKGGLMVDVGVRGFVPASHVGVSRAPLPDSALEKYVGQTVPLKVLEVDRARRKVVLSHRLAEQERREREREQVFASIQEGQVLEGTVRRIVDYGAFIDLGGIDGLLHISEMAWKRVKHPTDVLREGERVRVQVLRVDPSARKVSLGMKQLIPDPWLDAEKQYQVGQIVTGRVARLAPFGAIVDLPGDLEATIPLSELSTKRVRNAAEVVQEGQEVEALVVQVQPAERRMVLSLRRLQKQREEQENQQLREQYSSTGSRGFTIGEVVGKSLGLRTETEESSSNNQGEEHTVAEQ
ncbi:MAG: 30S ribosomal protein S1 [Armatimonadota bacterium]|nr:30S ribosomal protein S1 [bacterium]MCS7309915.1 30S ribosomal protein S1 [Armatimonadota bacterium]MDW8103885.1 30S ribosomal protein S1 [Armatimonadota bacterium]MDW8289116.1 30S ribosomal protein S1 [Armatimonadota bacterium]